MRVVYELKNYTSSVSGCVGEREIGRGTYAVVVLLKVFRDHWLMPRKRILQARVRVRRDPECRSLDIMRELVELLRVEQDLTKPFVPQHLAQDHAGVQRDILVLISRQRGEQHLPLARDVLDGRPARAYLTPKEIVEYLDDVFAGLEVELGDMGYKVVKQVGAISFLRELSEEFGNGLYLTCTKSISASAPHVHVRAYAPPSPYNKPLICCSPLLISSLAYESRQQLVHKPICGPTYLTPSLAGRRRVQPLHVIAQPANQLWRRSLF